VIALAKRYGAALIALSIDEEGQAYTIERKVSIARRIRDHVVDVHGMRESDLIFDPLTFTLGTGQEELRDCGVATLEAIRIIKETMPEAHTILGLSNCSFGLNPASRQVLNSVFLYHAVQSGLDMAIVHASKIQPLNRLDPLGAELAKKLVYDEREFEEVDG
jgi:5-methyltetrahydrofolate--homocysteine methyltransferase